MESHYQTAIDSGLINGAIVCATNSTGSFTYNLTIGQRTLLSGETIPHKLNDVIYLASGTKLITTIAALQCVQDGLLSLTDDITNILPELRDKQVLVNWSPDGETPIFEPQCRGITLEMLMTHSAGTSYRMLDPSIGKWCDEHMPLALESCGRKSRVAESLSYPLGHQPGQGWTYGVGLDWSGLAIERVTGGSLEEYVLEKVFKPLGISDAQFYPVRREDMRERMVDLNPTDPEGLGRAVLAGTAEFNKRSEGNFGGHGLFMTAEGYVKVLQSLLSNDGKILKKETVEDMFKDHLSVEASAKQQEVVNGPMGGHHRVGAKPGGKVGHGLGGLLALEGVEGSYGEGTMAWGGGMTLTWLVDRKKDVCGVAALQARVPVEVTRLAVESLIGLEGLKQCFREDVYCKLDDWKRGEN